MTYIALQIIDKDCYGNDIEIMTHFSKPEELAESIKYIESHKDWRIGNTYLVNRRRAE